MLNFHWLLLLFSSSFANVAVSASEASEQARQGQEQTRSGHPGGKGQAVRGLEPS